MNCIHVKRRLPLTECKCSGTAPFCGLLDLPIKWEGGDSPLTGKGTAPCAWATKQPSGATFFRIGDWFGPYHGHDLAFKGKVSCTHRDSFPVGQPTV